MDDIELLVNLLPDELVPPFRKKRNYLNSIMASNEVSRENDTHYKLAFKRVQRGWYILNPYIEWIN